MKIPLIYPKIPENSIQVLKTCHAFEKLDGTNMHWVWTLENGWHLFGTRRTQFTFNSAGLKEFNETHPELVNAPAVFNDKFRDKVNTLFSRTGTWCKKKVTLFTEFYGPNSFAGSHDANDTLDGTQTLTIIDISMDDKFFSPEQLVKDFCDLDIAKLVYTGKYNGQFAKDVIDGKYPVNEGVVVKGIVDDDKLFITKIKTKSYLKRLEENK